jgi:two-component system, cell cycle sensor histidine kinase and response regulator CckA
MAVAAPISTILLFLAASACIPLAIIAGQRRAVAGALPLAVMAMGIFLWTFANALQLLLGLEDSVGIAVMAFAGIAILPPAWLSFALQFYGRRMNRLLFCLCAGVWLLTIVLVLTNQYHHWFWRPMIIDGRLVMRRWWCFWTFAGYSYGIVSLGIIMLLVNLGRLPALYRRQGLIMAGAGLIPLLVSVLHIFSVLPRAPFDPTQLAFLASVGLASWALFRWRMLDLVPIPADILVEKISDALVVVDAQERLISLNQVAASLFGCHPENVIGSPANQLFPDWPKVRAFCTSAANAHGELTLAGKSPPKHLEIKTAAFYRRNGQLSGHLLLLRDVTEAKLRETEREQLVEKLQTALTQVKKLSGLLPICASCKKIRDEHNHWQPLESYLHTHTEAEFSHGLCPQCYDKYAEE